MSETYWQGEADKFHAKWIKALTDLETLKAENERLRSASFVTAVPAEQYERVIKAGDALIRICEVHKSNVDEYEIRWANWVDAKEGRDAK